MAILKSNTINQFALETKGSGLRPRTFHFPQQAAHRVKILYCERNGFCPWLKCLESERFKTSPEVTGETIALKVQELNGCSIVLISAVTVLIRFCQRNS